LALNHKRRCSICQSPLLGKKGHGFVTSSGVICANIRYHEKLRRQQRRRKTVDTEVEDMLFFEVEVADSEPHLLTEVTG
jgi:hypothetical protein